jgi:hypothetical protein
MMKPEKIRDAAAAVLSAGSMQESIASIRASINHLLDTSDCLYGLDSEESFKLAWTVAATAGSLVSGTSALLGSFQGLVPEPMIDETRAIISRFGRHVQGTPAELLADRDGLLAELELKLEDLTAVVRDETVHAPAGALLSDSDYASLLD